MSEIVGIWRLLTTEGRDANGAPIRAPYGPKPMGIVTFQSDGRLMAVLGDGRAELPEGAPPREFMAYCGNFTFDGTTLTTRVDASSETSRVGGDQVRGVRFRDGRMVLNPPLRMYQGSEQNHEIVWERVSG